MLRSYLYRIKQPPVAQSQVYPVVVIEDSTLNKEELDI
jgi:hypothetical protein